MGASTRGRIIKSGAEGIQQRPSEEEAVMRSSLTGRLPIRNGILLQVGVKAFAPFVLVLYLFAKGTLVFIEQWQYAILITDTANFDFIRNFYKK